MKSGSGIEIILFLSQAKNSRVCCSLSQPIDWTSYCVCGGLDDADSASVASVTSAGSTVPKEKEEKNKKGTEWEKARIESIGTNWKEMLE